MFISCPECKQSIHIDRGRENVKCPYCSTRTEIQIVDSPVEKSLDQPIMAEGVWGEYGRKDKKRKV